MLELRAAISMPGVVDSADAIDAAVNNPIPNTNNRRLPQRSPSVVAESINVAKASVYAFMNHWS
ncbi:hypothetical protein ABH922_001567 [Rhodococcus sp. 27YEA15]